MKDREFRDNPLNPAYTTGQSPEHQFIPLYTADLPDVHDIVADLRRVSEEFADRLLIGEIYLPPSKLVAYYGKELDGVHLPFNFSLLSAQWQATALAALIDEYESALPTGSWPNWVLGNHDRPTHRYSGGRIDQARVAAMLLLTLRGTPTSTTAMRLAWCNLACRQNVCRTRLSSTCRVSVWGGTGARTLYPGAAMTTQVSAARNRGPRLFIMECDQRRTSTKRGGLDA